MMYRIEVLHADAPQRTARVLLDRASQVLTAIRELLEQRHDCDRLVVYMDGCRMFAVDCTGNTVPD